MKKIIAGLVLLASFSCNTPQKEEATIRKRLGEFFQHFQELDADKLVDYYHPAIFRLTSREKVLEDMKAQIAGKSDLLKLHTFKIDSLYPVFQIAKSRYAKITYSAILLIDRATPEDSITSHTINAPSTGHTVSTGKYPAPQERLRRELIWGSEPGMEDLGIDQATGWSKFRLKRQFVAIKDRDAREWFLVSLDKDASPNEVLDKKVLAKLALYK